LPPAEIRMLTLAHKDTCLHVPDHGHYRIRKGTLAGHSIGGDVFLTVYGDCLDQYNSRKDNTNAAIMYDGQLVVVSLTTFVDDIGGFVIADAVGEAHKWCCFNTELLVSCLESAGCSLKPSKEVAVARWFRKQNSTVEYLQEGTVTSGHKKQVARYLGAWPQDNNKFQTEITKKCQAMYTGFYAFYGAWSSSLIPFQIKLCSFEPSCRLLV